MTQSQATAEVFYTAFRALKKSEREAFVARLLENEKLDRVLDKRKKEATVSLDEYMKVNERLEILQHKLDVFSGIKAGVKEVKDVRRKNRKLQKLSDFIDENRS